MTESSIVLASRYPFLATTLYGPDKYLFTPTFVLTTTRFLETASRLNFIYCMNILNPGLHCINAKNSLVDLRVGMLQQLAA